MPVAKGAPLDPERTRAVIVRSATDLLYRRGLDGVGVGELCTAVGASKETLYRHFGSKDGLIDAVLSARSDRVMRWLADTAAAAGDDPAAQLAAIFDALGGWYAEPDFRGCAIVNAAAQRLADPPRAIAARHLERYLELLEDIAVRAGAAEPAGLAQQLLMLVEGATVVADQHNSGERVATHARQAALTLLAAATSRSPR